MIQQFGPYVNTVLLPTVLYINLLGTKVFQSNYIDNILDPMIQKYKNYSVIAALSLWGGSALSYTALYWVEFVVYGVTDYLMFYEYVTWPLVTMFFYNVAPVLGTYTYLGLLAKY